MRWIIFVPVLVAGSLSFAMPATAAYGAGCGTAAAALAEAAPAAGWTQRTVVNESSRYIEDQGGLVITGQSTATAIYGRDGVAHADRTFDGGLTWPARQTIPGTSDDIHVASLGQHVDLLTSTTGPSRLWYLRSADGGATWSTRQLIGNRYGEGARVARGRNGVVAAVWWSDTNKLQVRVSTNGGRTFGAPHVVRTFDPGDGCAVLAPPIASVTVANTTVIVLYAKGKSEGTPYKTVVVRSMDGGANWTRPVVLGAYAWSSVIAAHGSDVVAQVGSTVKVSHDRGRTWSNASSRITLGVVRYAEGLWRSAYSYGDGIRYRTSVDGLQWSWGSYLPQYSEDLDTLDVTSWDGRGAVLAQAHNWSADRHALVVAVQE